MKILLKVCILLLVLIFNGFYVFGASIGLSPGIINFEKMLKGGYSERTLIISTADEQEVIVKFNKGGEIGDWISVAPNQTEYNISKNNPLRLKLVIQPPEDAQNKIYEGYLEFSTIGYTTLSGRAGGFVGASVISRINAEITGEEIISCMAAGFNVDNIEINFPFKMRGLIINEGNIRLTPTIGIDIWDQYQENLILSKNFISDMVLPTTQKDFELGFSNTLNLGQYWATITIDECKSKSLLTFYVSEKGSIIDKGDLLGIYSPSNIEVGETALIQAQFKNNGERDVLAKFVGNIRLNNKIVKVIETDEIKVPVNTIQDFNVYLTPDKPGKHIISGRVVFNNKLTYEKGGQIIVKGGLDIFSFFPFLIYIILAVTIFFIIKKIYKEKKKKQF